MFNEKGKAMIKRKRKARKTIIFPLVILILLFELAFVVFNFSRLYRTFLNDNPQAITRNIKITNNERQVMNEKHIKQGWFGYLYTDDNEIELPLYAGYAQWILNAGYGEVPTPQAQVGKDNFCVASHEYLVNSPYTNYGFSQLQFDTHKGEILHVDTPDNYEYDYRIIDKTVKTAWDGRDIVNKDYNTKNLHINEPTMMCYTCYSPSRFDPLPHPTKREIVTSVLAGKKKIKPKNNRYYQLIVENQKRHAHHGLYQWFYDFWFKIVKIQRYLHLSNDGQIGAN